MNGKHKFLYPKPLQKGAHIRIIAPSLSMGILSQDTLQFATERFEQMGFKISFGRHVSEIDQCRSSSIDSRIKDLHDAFIDKTVDGILTAIGGYNCNQLLEYIDWSLIAKNPKMFCGYSDITILNNAIFAQTGLVTFYGPHFSTFGQKTLDPYTPEYFLKAVRERQSFSIAPAATWSDDAWFLNQDSREFRDNDGYWVMQGGECSGPLIGGHLGTLCLLQGTPYMPSLTDSILMIEEDAEPGNPAEFDRRLQSVLQQPEAATIVGVLIGRFERAYGMKRELLASILSAKKQLAGKPIIANVDFGHTEPHCTLPVGGKAQLIVKNGHALLTIN